MKEKEETKRKHQQLSKEAGKLENVFFFGKMRAFFILSQMKMKLNDGEKGKMSDFFFVVAEFFKAHSNKVEGGKLLY